MDSTNTPYDDVFRTLLNDCSYLILPVINEIFGEHYTGDEQIIFSQNEHFFNQQDGKEQERITDSSFRIVDNTDKKYHLETIKNHLEDLLTQGQIDEYTKCTIIDMSGQIPRGNRQIYMQACPLGSLLRGNKVLEHIAKKYVTLRKGIKDVMRGKILEYEAKTIRNAVLPWEKLKARKKEAAQFLTEICQELGSSLIDTIEKVAIKFGLDEETSRKKVLIYWKNCYGVFGLRYAPLRSLLNEHPLDAQQPSRQSPNVHASLSTWLVASRE